MRSFLKLIIPRPIANWLARSRDIYLGYHYDAGHFRKHSASYKLSSKERTASFLVKEYHAIEKGLALPNPRPGFGQERFAKLIVVLKNYISQYGYDLVANATMDSLYAYGQFNRQYSEVPNSLLPLIDDLIAVSGRTMDGKLLLAGCKEVRKEAILEKLDFDFKGFFKSRYSVRDFDDRPVQLADVVAAVDLAKFSPSVCNRQPWKTFLVSPENTALKEELLRHQNGNAGFGDKISVLIVVTGKLSHFFSYERNQVYIDGGMFAMSILLSLHSKGLGTCCLNLSYTADKNKQFIS